MTRLRSKGKAQIIGQVFIYILSIVVIVFTFIFGYSAVVSFKEKTCNIELANFNRRLSGNVESIIPDYESVKTYSFQNPCGKYTQVCFVRNFQNNNDAMFPAWAVNPEANLPDPAYRMIKDNVDAKVKKNVFLVENTIMANSFFAGNIDVEPIDGILCARFINNNLKIRLEGRGNHAKVYEAAAS